MVDKFVHRVRIKAGLSTIRILAYIAESLRVYEGFAHHSFVHAKFFVISGIYDKNTQIDKSLYLS
jgi:hypothetical protein